MYQTVSTPSPKINPGYRSGGEAEASPSPAALCRKAPSSEFQLYLEMSIMGGGPEFYYNL